jgi:hypothetical protein
MALLANVRAVQKATPTGPPISGRSGNSAKAAAIARTAAAVVAKIRRRTLEFTDLVH